MITIKIHFYDNEIKKINEFTVDYDNNITDKLTDKLTNLKNKIGERIQLQNNEFVIMYDKEILIFDNQLDNIINNSNNHNDNNAINEINLYVVSLVYLTDNLDTYNVTYRIISQIFNNAFSDQLIF